MDDAGVVKVNDDLALVQTIDVFPPVVDDPYWYGRITAANSLSDIYAMGAKPLAAVNFVGYPLAKLGGEALKGMLEGAFEALEEADCAMAGGHSIADDEVKFGMGVTGTVHPDKVVRNVGARPGDVLVLSKPLGSGCLTTALKQGAADAAHIDAAHRIMARLNRNASEAMLRAGAHAATDVTGFGLVGHAFEIAEGSNVSIRIRAADVPLLPEAEPYLVPRFTCGGSKRNVAYAEGRIEIPADLPEAQMIALTDVQTSGGLLIAVAPDRADALIEDLRAGGDTLAAAIGVVDGTGPTLVVQ
jgi:selenide,water dikinase